jgi:hypothetical protein
LSRRRPHTTETGRPSTPVEVILRLLVVQHLYDWSYAQTEHLVSVTFTDCRPGWRRDLPPGRSTGSLPDPAADWRLRRDRGRWFSVDV